LILQLLRTPPPAGFTGNPLTYSIALVPYRTEDEARQLRLSVVVELENNWLSTSFTEIFRAIVLPNAQGIVHFDVARYLDAHLQYYVPDPRITTIQECSRQSLRYRIGYTLTDNNGVVVANTYTSPLVAIKGGYERTYQPGNAAISNTNVLLTTELVRTTNPLYPRANASIRYVPHELRYMYYLCRATATPTGTDRPGIEVVCTDTDDNDTHLFAEQQYRQWRVYCIPLTLPIVFPGSAWDPVSFTLNMEGLDTESAVFKVDTRAWYDTKCLLYRNSLGGISTITLRGKLSGKTITSAAAIHR
jgi:hypothetical protein